MKTEPKTPELKKMHAVKEKSQAIGEFLDIFLREQGIHLCRMHTHNKNCRGWDKERGRYNPDRSTGHCEWFDGQYYAADYQVEKLLAKFFKIDLKKVEAEKQALLDYVRSRG